MKIKKVLAAAFPYTIPVMAGYLCFGMAFGILLSNIGYGALWSALMCVVIYAGSMQFVAVELLSGIFSPVNILMITLMVNARHIFYGFSMLEKFKGTGKAKPYLIFSLTDETFSLLYSTNPPDGIPPGSFYTCIALLNHIYWITGGVIGTLVGSMLSFDLAGIEFVMTALFVSIFVEQWREAGNRIPGVIGLAGSGLCLALLGPDRFLLPAMVVQVLALTAARRPLEKRAEQ